MKAIIKLLKGIFWTVFYIVLAAIVAILVLPLWVGPVATTVANKVVPGIVKCDFNLGEFGLNQYSGALHVGKMNLANPEGFEKENCVELGTLDVKVDTLSCFTKKIFVENITLDGLTVSTSLTGANFRKIAENASGEKDEKGEGAEGEKDVAVEAPAETQQAPAEQTAEEKDGAPKVAIAKLVLKNITIKLSGVPISLPEIDIDGIGMDDPDGATFSEALDAVANKVMEVASSVGGAVMELGTKALDAGTEAATKALDAGTEAATKALDAGTEAATKALDSITQSVDVSAATEVVGEGASNAAKTVSEGTANTAKAVGEVGAGAVEAVGGAAGAAAGAVKDVGGAAVNSIKGLFK